MTARAISYLTPPTPCTQHVPSSHGILSRLRCTHVHHPIYPRPYLVPYGCAATSYHIPLTRSPMTHSSPLVLYTFSIRYASWSPLMSQVHQVSPSSEALCFFPWSSTILSSVLPFIPSFRLRPFPVYKPLSRRLCLSSLTWSLIPSLVQCSTAPLCVPL